MSSKALGKEDTFDVPAAKALSLLTHSPRRGDGGGKGAGLEQDVSASFVLRERMSSLGTGKTLPPFKVPPQVPARRPGPSMWRNRSPREALLVAVNWAVCRQRAV